MAQLAHAARSRGERVVFTNGCFDILHFGHVQYLCLARALGDHLFVGVNSDESARGLKGPGRPFNSEAARAGVLAALADVSAVTIFDEETASEVVRLVRPDIYVKGGDYSANAGSKDYPIEGETVSEYGGDVRILPFEPGYSTSSLIQRIRMATA